MESYGQVDRKGLTLLKLLYSFNKQENFDMVWVVAVQRYLFQNSVEVVGEFKAAREGLQQTVQIACVSKIWQTDCEVKLLKLLTEAPALGVFGAENLHDTKQMSIFRLQNFDLVLLPIVMTSF